MFQPSMSSFDTAAAVAAMDAAMIATALFVASRREQSPSLYLEHYGRTHRIAALMVPVRAALPAAFLDRFEAMAEQERTSLAQMAVAALRRLAA